MHKQIRYFSPVKEFIGKMYYEVAFQ